MKTKSKNKTISILQIAILIIGTIAIAYALNDEVEIVRGAGETKGDKDAIKALEDFIKKDNPTESALDSTEMDVVSQSEKLSAQKEPASNGMINKFLNKIGLKTGTSGYALASGVAWGFIAYGIANMILPMLGLDKGLSNALSTSAGAGVAIYQTLTTAKSGIFSGVSSSAIWTWALGGAAIVFLLTYKDQKQEIVTFECLPWQAPQKLNDCEKCNVDNYPCTEYRCKSLGQSCQLLNKNTVEEKCVNTNINDATPPIIQPDTSILTYGYEYTNIKSSPPSPGFQITRTGAGTNKCIQAFTPITFGIITDEPSQCRIDVNSTSSIEGMSAYFGASNTYKYNHSEILSLPNTKEFEKNNIILQNGKEITLFIRCRDNNNNSNAAEYAVNFCVDPTPDTTSPQIKATSIQTESCVAANQQSAIVDFYTNEPANCKWAQTDKSYELMENQMSCLNKIYQMNSQKLYTCQANLTGISRTTTDFYVKCEDLAGDTESEHNTMSESYKFNLKGSTALKVSQIKPNGTIYGAINPLPINLTVQTLFGCESDKAICKFSTQENGEYIDFAETNTEDGFNLQKLYLSSGDYTYYIKCVDAGGNLVLNRTTFTVDIDTSAPVIARIYNEEDKLKIVTVRESQCSYTFQNCDFTFEEGTEMPYSNSVTHVAEWNSDKTYYIKCRDEFRDISADCSAIVKPTEMAV